MACPTSTTAGWAARSPTSAPFAVVLTRLEELEAHPSSDEINTYSKKMQARLNREYRKMYRNLNGMRTMNRLPECLIVVDPNKEKNAVREAQQDWALPPSR